MYVNSRRGRPCGTLQAPVTNLVKYCALVLSNFKAKKIRLFDLFVKSYVFYLPSSTFVQ